MALSDFILIQQYITILLLVAAAVFWHRLRQETDLSQLRAHRVYSMTLLLTLPFLINVMTFIPDPIAALLNHILFLLIFVVLAVRSMKSYRSAFAERKEALRELYEDAGKHPIRLEFARHIVEPEMKKTFALKEKLALEKREVQMKMRTLAQHDERLQNKLQRIEEVQKKIREDDITLAKKNLSVRDRERQLAYKEKTLQNKITEYDELKKRYSHFHHGKFVGFALGCDCSCGHKNVRLLTPRLDCDPTCEEDFKELPKKKES